MKGWKIINPLTLEEREISEVSSSESLTKVKITKALITLSDVLRYKGELDSNNVVLGSSGIGIISETEANLFGLEKGMHVYIEPNRECLECYSCKSGNPTKCSNLQIAGEDFDDIAAVLCGNVSRIEIKEGNNPLEFALCARGSDGTVRPLPRQDLLLFTPFQPEADNPYGVSMLRSMPFLTEILLKIWQAIGLNWERVGNVRFAVVCKGENDGMAEERCKRVAQEWSAAMQSGREGAVRDFVASGDVEIRVIGADNQILDSEVPVRQILEQLVARTGIPPFLLGLSWSSTERMSSQQADIMTSEIDAIRRGLTPVVERICSLWLRLNGYDRGMEVMWDTVNLQDEETMAKAALYRAQTAALESGEE